MKREIVDDAGDPVLDEEGNPKEKHFAILRGFNLFNIDGCDIKVVHSLDRDVAAYYPKQDHVLLPAKECFHDAEGYYSVALHELTHATGHDSRLARAGITDLDATFGSPKYALEELVAQLGSAFLCGHFGIRNEAFDTTCIASWIQELRGDKRAIFRATGAARLAAEFLKPGKPFVGIIH